MGAQRWPPRVEHVEGTGATAAGTSGAHGQGTNPAGDHRGPWLVIVLSFITLGIYFWYWLWVTSQETDRFDPQHASAHKHAKWAVPVGIAGFVLNILGVLLFLGSAGAALDTATSPEQLWAAMGTSMLLVGLGGLAALAGMVGVLIALWRMWGQIGFHEQAIGHEPLSQGRMLAIVIGGILLGGVLSVLLIGWLVTLAAYAYVLHRTQTGLNRIWAAGQQGYTPPPKPTPGYPGGPSASQHASQPAGTGSTGSGSPGAQGSPGTGDR